VLVTSEESRLGREAIETGYVLKQIMDAGVRVFFYLEDRERTLDSAMDKVMLSLLSLSRSSFNFAFARSVTFNICTTSLTEVLDQCDLGTPLIISRLRRTRTTDRSTIERSG